MAAENTRQAKCLSVYISFLCKNIKMIYRYHTIERQYFFTDLRPIVDDLAGWLSSLNWGFKSKKPFTFVSVKYIWYIWEKNDTVFS